jgi:hypothetical protein
VITCGGVSRLLIDRPCLLSESEADDLYPAPQAVTSHVAVAADNGGVRRWQVVLVVVLAMLPAAIFVVVKFFQFVGSQN